MVHVGLDIIVMISVRLERNRLSSNTAPLRKTHALMPRARELLKKKNFAKARYLAKKMDISGSLAGRILEAMPEWLPYTKRSSQSLWIRRGISAYM